MKTKITVDENALKFKLEKHRESAFDFQRRRHTDWKENYQLYRDKVIINRIIQRQSVNMPLMKETIKTILSKIDDPPDLFFASKDNNKELEIEYNAYWKDYYYDKDKLEIKDVVDKKQVLIYGRSTKVLNIIGGKPTCEIYDPYDVLFDRFTDPSDIDATCQYLRLQHVYKPLKALAMNPMYNKAAIGRLKAFYATEAGLLKAEETNESMRRKNERMQSMGVPDVNDPKVGEIYVEIAYEFVKLYDAGNKKNVWSVVIWGGFEMLAVKTVQEILGLDFLPAITWADDIERTDIYSDSVADICRTPNKIVNARFSQWIENGTLRGFGMNYYDSTKKGFQPPSIQPAPWAWIPVPGKPSEVFQKVDVPDISISVEEINFIVGMVERATASTAVEKGVQEKGATTLGEIKMMSEKAMERVTSMAKFYRIAWKEFGDKWCRMIEANGSKLKEVTLHKKGYKGNFYSKQVNPSKFKTGKGWNITVTSSAEQDREEMDTVQKLSAVKGEFQGNKSFDRIYKKKLLDIAKLNPEEINEVLDEDKQNEALMEKAAAQNPAGMQGAPTGPAGQPPMPTPQPVGA